MRIEARRSWHPRGPSGAAHGLIAWFDDPNDADPSIPLCMNCVARAPEDA